MNALLEQGGSAGGTEPTGGGAKAFDTPARDVRAPAPVANSRRNVGASILVGHTCPLVATGLLATLSRLMPHDVLTLGQLDSSTSGSSHARKIDVVVADRILAGRLAMIASCLDRSGEPATPKIVLIGADTGSWPVSHDDRPAYDACVPLECRPSHLVDVVNALIRSAPAGLPAPRNPEPYGRSGPVYKRRPRGGLPSAALRRVREAMEQRLDQKLELTELAALAGVSRSHFARAFKESVGQSPHRYLMMRRIAAAEALIRDTDRRLTDISVDVGCFDQSHFVRLFTRVVGETPGAYRRRHLTRRG
jgi:AraC-like DNA-binding protein